MRRSVFVALGGALVWTVVAAASGPGGPVATVEHPLLLVRPSMYDDLRARAETSPWKEMKAEALALAMRPVPPGESGEYLAAREIISAATLAYILDPDHRPAYRRQVLAAVEATRGFRIGGPAWERQVPPGTVLLHLVLALDVMHDGFTADELAGAEAVLDERIGRIDAGWAWNLYGLRAAWALYRGDREECLRNVERFHEAFARDLTGDGVWGEGPNYAYQRFSRLRDTKCLVMDICEFTGTGSFYANPTYRQFYEWLYGYALTPMHSAYTFGDSHPNYLPFEEGPAAPPLRAARFSEAAGGYAAFRLRGRAVVPSLPGYVLLERPLPEPMKPASRIFRDGGAFFVEDDQVSTSLAGALWNSTQRGWHSHCDVNAVHLCAYGENILQNVGYAGAGNGVGDYPWEYISHEARANNTVLIDGVNQRVGTPSGDGGDWTEDPARDGAHSKRGAGITEGFTSRKLDYACGSSGRVLPNGGHERSLVFVHPQDGLPGYFVLFDEIWASPGSRVDVFLHPNSHEREPGQGCQALREGELYGWTIDGKVRFNPDNEVRVQICLGSPPAATALPLGVLTAWGSDDWQTVGRYLHATYATDARGRAALPTVIYPSDRTHPPATMTRLDLRGGAGVRVEAGQAGRDFVLAVDPDADEPVTLDDVTIAGRAAVFRRGADGQIAFYFARLATQFADGRGAVGFRSDGPVSIHLRGREGQVVSAGARLTLMHPGLRGVLLDGQPVAADVTDGQGTVVLAPGMHGIALVIEP